MGSLREGSCNGAIRFHFTLIIDKRIVKVTIFYLNLASKFAGWRNDDSLRRLTFAILSGATGFEKVMYDSANKGFI